MDLKIENETRQTSESLAAARLLGNDVEGTAPNGEYGRYCAERIESCYADLRAQRDELRAALVAIGSECERQGETEYTYEIGRTARAALRRCEKGKP